MEILKHSVGKLKIGLVLLVSLLLIPCGCTQQAPGQLTGSVQLQNTNLSSDFEPPETSSYLVSPAAGVSSSAQVNEILLQFAGSKQKVKQVLQKYQLQEKRTLEQLNVKLVTTVRKLTEILPKLRREEVVVRAGRNTPVQLKTSFTSVSLPNLADKQWSYPLISLPAAWQEETGSQEVTVAVLDTGVDLDHPDLKANLVAGKDFVDPYSTADDEYGHGTHVAGIIGATANSQGIVGATPQVNIMPVRVLNAQGRGTICNIVDGILWAANHGADVINLSLGSSFPNQFYQPAIEYAHQQGVTIVAAAGNGGYDIPREGNAAVGYPGRYDHVIAVGALTSSLELTYYSNYGKRLDFVAPGNYIYSTVPLDLKNDWNKMTNETGYMLSSGTSMAAPHIAGVAALIIAAKQASAPKQVRRQLKLTAQDLGPNGRDLEFGFGLINAHAAVVDAEITEIKIFAGRRKGDTITKLTKVVHPTSAGTYCLPSPETGDYFLYGWIDMTKDDKINKGDYFGRQRVAKAGTGIDFSLDLITNNINIYLVQEESP